MGDSLVPLDYYEDFDTEKPHRPKRLNTKLNNKAEKVKCRRSVDFWQLFTEKYSTKFAGRLGNSAESPMGFLSPEAPILTKDLESRVAQFPLKQARLCQVLILVSSALRALEIMRSLENHRKKHKIGKLFAKHIKLREQIEFLKGNSVPIAVGTPSRVLQLLEETELLNEVSCLLIDSTKDLKERTIVSMKETCDPLLDVVFKLKDRLVNRKCHISLVG